jgi:hypothetical protein
MSERYFDTIESSILYLLVVGFIYTLAFLFCACVAVYIPPVTLRDCGRRLLKLGLFLLILLLVGDLFGVLWSATICGRLYSSFDYDVADFLPFVPITRSFIEVPFEGYTHQLNGFSLNELEMIWYPFALGTWGTTLMVYRWVVRKGFRRRQSLEVSNASA